MDEVTKDAEDDCVDSVSFWRHLQLLLWKNYTQKKRSPITVLFELFIPLIIFIVLSVVRSTQQEVPRPSEYGQGVALPSAGLIPVLQYFCPPVSSDPYGIPDYSNSKVPQLLEFIHYISNSNDSLLDAKNVESVITEIRENMKAIDTQHMSDHLSSDPSILKQMLTDPDTKIDITSNPAMQKVLSNAHYLQTLEEQLDWIKPISEHLDIFITDSNVCNSQNTAFKSPLNHTVTKQMFIEQSIRQPTKPVELLFKAWNVFQMVLCGVNVTENNYEEYQGNWSNINTKLSENLFSHLQPLSSILLGKARIAYAPNTTDVNDVIKMTSSYFHSFKRLSVLADKWLNISRPVVDFMEENSTQDLYRLLQQVQTILQNTSGVNFTRDEQLIISTSLPDLDKIRHIMELLDTVACFVNSLSSHLDVDVFHPLSNEQSFLNYTNDVRGQSSRMVIAGLVFDVDDSGKLPSHVKYKLKMNTTNFSRSSETFKIEEKTWTQLHVHPVMMFGLDLNDTTLGDLPKLIIDRMELNLTQDGPLGKIIVRTLKLLDYLNSKLGLMIFPWLQDLVDRAIIEKKVGHNITEPGNYIQEFPYPCHVNDPFLHKMGRFTNMMLLLGWLYYVVLVTQSIVYEKEQKLKEMMKIAGLNNLVHWVAWFITGFVEMTVSTTLLVFILKYGRVFAYTDAFLFWLYNMLYAVCTLLFCFVVSVFFSKAKLGAACAGIIYLLCNIPFWFIQDQENSAFKTVSRLQKIISCLASPSAYGLGLRYAHFYERQAIGLQWSNVNEPWPPFNEDLTMADVMLIMFCDCIMYIILIWYIEAVFPGNYGVPKAWYFPVQKPYHYIKSLCTCRTSKNSYNLPRNLRSADFCQGEGNAGRKVLLEGEPLGCKLGIHIDNIVKVYKQGKVRAVNNLNLNLYEGQITALLGHNGAGKTTIMSILTGFIPPTSGVATVNGYDIIEDMANIRQNLGVCLQYNALFDKLTVEEHLWFFSQLKGYSLTQLRITMHRLLTDTGLMHKRHSTVTQLSGGMKRKLSVAIAFTGGSKTVILDEPTAGVDPYARRAIWDLLLKNKQDCTILLSTHHMDEASLLGDRIAIISSGQLQCCGSPHYLKQMYGDGYKLIVTKKGFNELNGASSEDPLSSRLPSTPSSPSLSASFSASTMVTSFIRKHIPSATLHSEKNNVLVYTMPKENTKKSQFIDLFEGLSRNQLSLEISSYEVTESTLEQIFLKVTQEDTEVPHVKQLKKDGFKTKQLYSVFEKVAEDTCCEGLLTENDEESSTNSTGIKADKVESRQKSHGIHLTLTRVVGQLLKRLHYMKRDIKILVSQLLMPVVFLLLAIWGAISISVDPGKAFSMELNSEIFKADTFYVPYTDQSWTCLRNNDQCPDSQEILDTQKLIRTLLFKAGLGASYTVLSNDNNTTLDLFNQSSSIWVGNLTEKLDLVVNYSLSINHNRDNVSEAIEGYALPVEYLYGTPYTEYDMDCECREDNTGLDCPESIAKPDVAQVQVPSGEILLDISGRNFTQYLINTYREFHLNRYGALSFGSVREFVPREYKMNISKEFHKLIARNVAVAWYNEYSYLSRYIYVNILNNAILRANIDPMVHGNPSKFGITTIDEPMQTELQLVQDFLTSYVYLKVAVLILVGMSFIPASVVMFVIMERSSKAKLLQFISGVSPLNYWISNYIWDMLSYFLPVLCCVVILQIFYVPAFSSSENLAPFIILFIMFGWSIIPMMYLASFLFTLASKGYVCLLVFNLFVGITTTNVIYVMQHLAGSEALKAAAVQIDKVFVLFPNYCLGHGIHEMAYHHILNTFYKKIGAPELASHPLEWHVLSRMFVVMAIEGCLFFTLTLLCEYGFFTRSCQVKKLSAKYDSVLKQDANVADEKQRVFNETNDVLRLLNISKVYKGSNSRKFVAVDRLYLGVPRGQCFGLLGVNGAGKTSLFRMLTGDATITTGDAYVHGYSISKQCSEVYEHIGYCPQFDALFDKLTPREHLFLYARLRGVPRNHRKQMVKMLLEKLGLQPYADRTSNTLSGGNKRKLSTAIALTGNPSVLFMDEPTTGMDPQSKRFLWSVILEVIQTGRSVVLTSHSMEECEHLCSRLAIMVNGRLQCLGTLQHIKNTYGNGYTVTVILKNERPHLQYIIEDFRNKFPQAICKDQRFNMVEFELNVKNLSLSHVFSHLELMKKRLYIEDYSVRQTTLDDVFVNFAKKQKFSSSNPRNPEGIQSGMHAESDNLLVDQDHVTVQYRGAAESVAFAEQLNDSSCIPESPWIQRDEVAVVDEDPYEQDLLRALEKLSCLPESLV